MSDIKYELKREMPSMGGVSTLCDCIGCHQTRKFNRNFKGCNPQKVLKQNFTWSEVSKIEDDKSISIFVGKCPEKQRVARIENNAMIFAQNPNFRLDRNTSECNYSNKCLNLECPASTNNSADDLMVEAAKIIDKLLA